MHLNSSSALLPAAPQAHARLRVSAPSWPRTLLGLVDRLLPRVLVEAQGEALHAARKIVVVSLGMVLWGPIFGVIYGLLDAPNPIVVGLLASPLLVLPSLAMVHRGASRELTAMWTCLALVTVLVGLAFTTGGSSAPALWWLVLLPVVGVVLDGVRTGALLTIVGIAVAVAFVAIEATGHLPPVTLSGVALGQLNVVAQIALLLALAGMSFAHATFEDRNRSELATALEQVSAEMKGRAAAETRLRQTHRLLVDAAHRAGMAETATGVLHNVGNALNGVSVSSSLLQSGIHGLEFDGIDRAAGLLQSWSDAPESDGSDPAALAGYLRALSLELREQQRKLVDETHTLRTSTAHVVGAIRTQQHYARRPSTAELTDVESILADALNIEGSSFARRGIQIEQDLEELPPLQLDRNRLVQILMNLLSNARHAIRDTGRGSGRIRISGGLEAGRWLRLAISDDGLGFDAEVRDQIFEYGFTTKRDGHGFGLHASATVATELGGTLECHSDGPGRGALFVLRIPVGVEEGAP